MRTRQKRIQLLLSLTLEEKERTAARLKFAEDLERTVELPGHDPVTTGDLLAAEAYARYAEARASAGR